MLLKFSVENWLSFRNQASFSMIASRERQHKERVPRLDKYQIGILPLAVIYGGNASGKTNFFKALNFVKTVVVKGTQPDSLIPVEHFRLDSQVAELPTSFEIEILAEDTIYEYSFAVTRKAVLEEKLVQISNTSEKVLFFRKNDKPNFHNSIKDPSLEFAFKGTRDNQLFLTNSVSQKIDSFRPIYDWFKNTLELVAPDSRFELFDHHLDESAPLYATMNTRLSQLDTGITRIAREDIPFANLQLSDSLKMTIQETLKEGKSIRFINSILTRKNGELIAKKLVTYHKKSDGSEIKFDIRQESDGSQRIIDLLPVFLEMGTKVIVIDELDRSLHTLLSRSLIETYLSTCTTNSRSQLLFTTHDVLLMDQEILRRDEMWVAERNAEGVSNLLSFSEFKDVRYDKDIRKSYLQGRLGGVPRILALSHNDS